MPDFARLKGTMRTLRPLREAVREDIHRVAENIACAHDCTAEVVITEGFPLTICDSRAVDLAEQVATDLGGEFLRLEAPLMGAEDFSYVLEKVPGRCSSSAWPRTAPTGATAAASIPAG